MSSPRASTSIVVLGIISACIAHTGAAWGQKRKPNDHKQWKNLERIRKSDYHTISLNVDRIVKTRYTERELEASMNKHGVHYFRDSFIYGTYFYDTSALAPTKTKVNTLGKIVYYRVRNFVGGRDTIPEITFNFSEYSDYSEITKVPSPASMIYDYYFEANRPADTAARYPGAPWKEPQYDNWIYRLMEIDHCEHIYNRKARRYRHIWRRHFIKEVCKCRKAGRHG